MLKPADIRMNTEGFVSRSVFIRLPADFTLQDLNDALRTAWKNVQKNTQCGGLLPMTSLGSSMRRSALPMTSKSFCAQSKNGMPARNEALFEDNMYRIEWAGSGFAVYRKSDSIHIGAQTFTTVEQAKAFLLQQYPRKAS